MYCQGCNLEYRLKYLRLARSHTLMVLVVRSETTLQSIKEMQIQEYTAILPFE